MNADAARVCNSSLRQACTGTYPLSSRDHVDVTLESKQMFTLPQLVSDSFQAKPEQQPSALKVLHLRDAVKKRLVLH